ncbi:hypothetical protein HYV43_06880 [Candidatus Micrarchaeota archaeon]|nr:hypothetical protein [Candidatus Micrarchaeota archaeon]
MNTLSTLALLAGYLAFWAVLLSAQRVWLDAQSVRVDAVLDASAKRWQCASAEALGNSGFVVLFDFPRPDCGPPSWRPEVVRRVS